MNEGVSLVNDFWILSQTRLDNISLILGAWLEQMNELFNFCFIPSFINLIIYLIIYNSTDVLLYHLLEAVNQPHKMSLKQLLTFQLQLGPSLISVFLK